MTISPRIEQQICSRATVANEHADPSSTLEFVEQLPLELIDSCQSQQTTCYGVSDSASTHRTKRDGLKLRRTPSAGPTALQQQILRLKDSMTLAAIGRRFDLSRQRVHQICRRWQPKPDPMRPKEKRTEIVSFRLTASEASTLRQRLPGQSLSRAARKLLINSLAPSQESQTRKEASII